MSSSVHQKLLDRCHSGLVTQQLTIADRSRPTLSTSDAARLLGVSERTVRRFMAGGSITYYRIGGLTRFRKCDIEAFIEAGRVPSMS